jgi:hypothetical protein
MAQADSLFALACQQANLTAQPGKQAMKGAERDSVELEGKGRWTHSVDLDGAHAKSEAQSPRWDYGLGLRRQGAAECAVWVEPHPANSTGEVEKMLAKLRWLQAKLKQPAYAKLAALTQDASQQNLPVYVWLCSGGCTIRPGTREAHLLAKAGLHGPRRQLKL